MGDKVESKQPVEHFAVRDASHIITGGKEPVLRAVVVVKDNKEKIVKEKETEKESEKK
ncbi:MAG: hypothetical protein WAV41_01970 [Microgenomates group bacterium]